MYRKGEACKNPWDKKCENRDIAVYIDYKNRRMPICRLCWKEIADSTLEW